MNNNKQLISFSYIRVKYPSSKKELVYRGNIEINENDFVLFSGNSGCGKSTIFKVLNMLIPDYEYASVETDLKIKDISYKEEKNINKLKDFYRPVCLFQNPYTQIVTPYVKNEIIFPLENRNFNKEEIKKRFHEIVKKFNLYNFLDKITFNLSGGEIQKIQLASLLTIDPEILFLDEPTSFIDFKYKKIIYSILRKLKNNKTIIIIDHDFQKTIDLYNKFIYIKKENEDDKHISYKIESFENKDLFLNYYEKEISFFNKLEKKFFIDLKEKYKKNEKKTFIKIKNLYFSYEIKKNLKTKIRERFDNNFTRNFLLKNINLEISEGVAIILGENGSGKTTLIKLICNILKPYRGEIFLSSNYISIIFQNPESHFLFPTIEKEILSYFKNKKLAIKFKENLTKLINFESYLNKSPYELSEGEKKRFTLISNLLIDKDIYIFDEPTFGQDFANKIMIINFIKYLKSLKKTILIITHDIEFAKEIGDSFYILKNSTLTKIDKEKILKLENLKID